MATRRGRVRSTRAVSSRDSASSRSGLWCGRRSPRASASVAALARSTRRLAIAGIRGPAAATTASGWVRSVLSTAGLMRTMSMSGRSGATAGRSCSHHCCQVRWPIVALHTTSSRARCTGEVMIWWMRS